MSRWKAHKHFFYLDNNSNINNDNNTNKFSFLFNTATDIGDIADCPTHATYSTVQFVYKYSEQNTTWWTKFFS